jgi:hypothetical protein
MTGEEFSDSLAEEKDFFQDMEGPVGVIFELHEVNNLPPSILTLARRARFASYPSTIIVTVGANTFIRVMASSFSKLTGKVVHSVDTMDAAWERIRREMAKAKSE